MSFIENIFDRLFPKDKKDTVLSHEVLKRTDREFASYAEWVENPDTEILLKKIHRIYHLKKTGISDTLPLMIYESDYANGFALAQSRELEDFDYTMLMDHFKHRVLDAGYRQAGSDRKITAKESHVLTVEKYYLKPPIQIDPPIDQKFGNISLELVLHDGRPDYLKVMASIYSDRLYKPHQDFNDLIDLLFSLK